MIHNNNLTLKTSGLNQKPESQNDLPKGTTKKLRFKIDEKRRNKSKFSEKDGKIYVQSNKRSHRRLSSRISSKLRSIFRSCSDCYSKFCCSFGIPDSEIGDENDEKVKFKTKEERLKEEWLILTQEKGKNKLQKETISLKEVKQLLRKMNASVPQREITNWMKRYSAKQQVKSQPQPLNSSSSLPLSSSGPIKNQNETQNQPQRKEKLKVKLNLNFEEFSKMYFSLESLPDLREYFLRAKLKEIDDEKVIEKMGITHSKNWQWAKYEYLVLEDLKWFFNWISNGTDVKTDLEITQLIEKFKIKKNSTIKIGTNETPIVGSKHLHNHHSSVYDLFHLKPHPKSPRSPSVSLDKEKEIELKMSYEEFVKMMIDLDNNDVISKKKRLTVYQDMTKPLSFYYISSSHNSYLLGNQLNSESSPKAIERILKLGVRVVELDCWDPPSLNSTTSETRDIEVIVNHGHTLCKPTSFRSCIELINRFAFYKSKYPLIITLENHCSYSQQLKQVLIMKEIFKSKLFIPPAEEKDDEGEVEDNNKREYLSPEALKGKIIIRDKITSKKKGNKHEELLKIIYIKNISLPVPKKDNKQQLRRQKSEVNLNKSKSKKKYTSIIYDEPMNKSSSSITETEFKKLIQKGYNSASMNTYCKRHLLRIYPAVTRISSTNYDPILCWNSGCQIVALNYQNFKFKIWLNQGKFSDNGGCGYILKSKKMINSKNIGVVIKQKEFYNNLQSDKSKIWSHKLISPLSVVPEVLVVTIISAHYLPKRSIDLKYQKQKSQTLNMGTINPFIELKLRGLKKKDIKTSWVESNGFNPRWNETFEFEVFDKNLSFLALIVKSRDKTEEGSFVAQRVLPMDCIDSGLKIVNLYFKNCTRIESAFLVCRFYWKTNSLTSV